MPGELRHDHSPPEANPQDLRPLAHEPANKTTIQIYDRYKPWIPVWRQTICAKHIGNYRFTAIAQSLARLGPAFFDFYDFAVANSG
jgi:hypothetical protein